MKILFIEFIQLGMILISVGFEAAILCTIFEMYESDRIFYEQTKRMAKNVKHLNKKLRKKVKK